MEPTQSAAILALINMYPEDALACFEDAGSTDAETDLKTLVASLSDEAGEEEEEPEEGA